MQVRQIPVRPIKLDQIRLGKVRLGKLVLGEISFQVFYEFFPDKLFTKLMKRGFPKKYFPGCIFLENHVVRLGHSWANSSLSYHFATVSSPYDACVRPAPQDKVLLAPQGKVRLG